MIASERKSIDIRDIKIHHFIDVFTISWHLLTDDFYMLTSEKVISNQLFLLVAQNWKCLTLFLRRLTLYGFGEP